MWGIRKLAEKSNKTSSRLFYLRGADPESFQKQRKKRSHVMTLHMHVSPPHLCTHASMHTHLYTCLGTFFFPFSIFSFLHRLRQSWTMSLCRLSDSSIQVMLSRHIPMCCPTAESSYSFEPKQGVAIPLPACPLLSPHQSMVEEQGFKWTGGAVGKVTQYTLLCNHLQLKYNSVVRFHSTGKGCR